MTISQAPTYADLIVTDPQTKKQSFNPIWLDWFLTLTSNTNSGITAAQATALVANYFTSYFGAKTLSSGSDITLQVGQHAVGNYSGATSIPLNIACGDGQVYNLLMEGTFTAAAPVANTVLAPNNTTGWAATQTILQGYGASTVAYAASTLTDIVLCPTSPYVAEVRVFTSTAAKRAIVDSQGYETTNLNRHFTLRARLNDTTTVWSSLGTIALPNAWTGTIIATRVA